SAQRLTSVTGAVAGYRPPAGHAARWSVRKGSCRWWRAGRSRAMTRAMTRLAGRWPCLAAGPPPDLRQRGPSPWPRRRRRARGAGPAGAGDWRPAARVRGCCALARARAGPPGGLSPPLTGDSAGLAPACPPPRCTVSRAPRALGLAGAAGPPSPAIGRHRAHRRCAQARLAPPASATPGPAAAVSPRPHRAQPHDRDRRRTRRPHGRVTRARPDDSAAARPMRQGAGPARVLEAPPAAVGRHHMGGHGQLDSSRRAAVTLVFSVAAARAAPEHASRRQQAPACAGGLPLHQ
ncbi:uncharacterized protein V1510DRAFT_441091, partial [Dipodascopsis tothii]|uniref:uncharacterized protein n=1 Tax=Dipodascopsis tothii TaxID=44089 RepID=UPI0034CEDEAC